MIFLKKYGIYLLIVFAFFAGFLLKTRNVKPEIEQLEKQKQEQQAIIDAKDRQLLILSRAEATIRNRMKKDSIENSEHLKRKEIEISRLKKRINNVSFKNYTTDRLDSLRGILYGSGR
jgi:hypothetical protein